MTKDLSKKPIAIGSVGFDLYFTRALVASSFVAIAYFSARVLELKSSDPLLCLGIFFTIIICLTVDCCICVFTPKIILTHDELIVKNLGIIPYDNGESYSVNLRDIEEVALLEAGALDTLAHQKCDTYVIEKIKRLKTARYRGLNEWVALQYTPLIYILSKNSSSKVISTKLFSRGAIKRLFEGLKIRGATVTNNAPLGCRTVGYED